MAQIVDIKNKFSTIATTITDIQTFMFDAFSMVNSNRSKTYPVLLLKVPETATKTTVYGDWKDYNIEFFVLDTHNQTDTETREEVWDRLQTISEQVIIELKDTPNIYRIKDKQVNFDYGYDVLNDKLVAVKASLTLSAFNCYTAFTPPSGGITWATWTGLWTDKTANWNTYT